MANPILGLFNLGGGEILLLLILVSVFVVLPVIALVLALVLYRAARKEQAAQIASAPPPVQAGRPCVTALVPRPWG